MEKLRQRLLRQPVTCEDREFFENIRFKVVELAGIKFRKSPPFTRFLNGNRELYTG